MYGNFPPKKDCCGLLPYSTFKLLHSFSLGSPGKIAFLWRIKNYNRERNLLSFFRCGELCLCWSGFHEVHGLWLKSICQFLCQSFEHLTSYIFVCLLCDSTSTRYVLFQAMLWIPWSGRLHINNESRRLYHLFNLTKYSFTGSET